MCSTTTEMSIKVRILPVLKTFSYSAKKTSFLSRSHNISIYNGVVIHYIMEKKLLTALSIKGTMESDLFSFDRTSHHIYNSTRLVFSSTFLSLNTLKCKFFSDN